MKLKIGFWNTNRKKIDHAIKKYVVENDIDILGLAEYSGDITSLLLSLKADGLSYYLLAQIECKRVHIISKLIEKYLDIGREHEHFTIRSLIVPEHETINLSFVHFPSKLFKNPDSQIEHAAILKEEIEIFEEKNRCGDTIILGDFNMSPFEKGIINARGLSAIPCKDAAVQGERILDFRPYKVFFNPMWNKFGYLNGGPGSYYYSAQEYENYYWHIFDQVLYRGTLVDQIDLSKIEIVKKVSDMEFVDEKGYPIVSDHLPVQFELILKRR